MMLWEVMNMSDYYTIKSDDFAAACGACLLLGNGNYGLVPISEDAAEMPIFLFSPVDRIDRWLSENKIADSCDALFSRREEIAAALDTVVIGDRGEYETELAKINDSGATLEFKSLWHKKHRTSANDIGKRAVSLAEAMRKPKPSGAVYA